MTDETEKVYSEEEQLEILSNFAQKLAGEQVEIAQVINESFWQLI